MKSQGLPRSESSVSCGPKLPECRGSHGVPRSTLVLTICKVRGGNPNERSNAICFFPPERAVKEGCCVFALLPWDKAGARGCHFPSRSSAWPGQGSSEPLVPRQGSHNRPAWSCRSLRLARCLRGDSGGAVPPWEKRQQSWGLCLCVVRPTQARPQPTGMAGTCIICHGESLGCSGF